MVDLLDGVFIQSLRVRLCVGTCHFQVHHFFVGLGQLEHHLSADHKVVLGVQFCWDTETMAPHCRSHLMTLMEVKKFKEKQTQLTIADGLQHVNPSLVHFTASFQVLLKESQGPEEGAVILQDLYVIRHVALDLKVLFGLKSDERRE